MQIFPKESVKKVGFCGILPQNESTKVSKVPRKNEIALRALPAFNIVCKSRSEETRANYEVVVMHLDVIFVSTNIDVQSLDLFLQYTHNLY